MLSIFLYILLVIIVAGAAAFIINRAPFIEEPMRSWAGWLIMAVALIVIVIMLVQMVGGGAVDLPRLR